MEESKSKKVFNFFKEIFVTLLIAIVLFFVITYFVQIGKVSGASMESTYEDSDIVLINKFTDNFEKNDIIVFTYTDEHQIYYEDMYYNASLLYADTSDKLDEFHVKRIVGVPGDEVEIKDGDTYINGEFVSHTSQQLVDQNYTLDEDYYFVEGDNSDHSFDSRQHGPVYVDDLFGKVITNK